MGGWEVYMRCECKRCRVAQREERERHLMELIITAAGVFSFVKLLVILQW